MLRWYRYSSFAMVTGRPLAFLLPALVVFTNVSAIPGYIEGGHKRYGNAFTDYASSVPAIVLGLQPALSGGEAQMVAAGGNTQ